MENIQSKIYLKTICIVLIVMGVGIILAVGIIKLQKSEYQKRVDFCSDLCSGYDFYYYYEPMKYCFCFSDGGLELFKKID